MAAPQGAPVDPAAAAAARPASVSRKLEPPRAPSSQTPSGALKILHVADVKPGMVGEAWTVFRGIKPEPFKVRVISVLKNFIPKQDVILVRAEDPRVEFSGIAAGMSGSPVYVDGKLMGAIAYAWSFAKEPLAGVTPIESMLAERARPIRGGASDSFYVQAGMPGADRASTEGSQLVPIAAPLAISGLSLNAFNEYAEQLKPFGLLPVRGAGGGRDKKAVVPNDALVPGAPVGVELVRGDMSAVAMGTLTYLEGDKLIAFGHPMFGIGEVNLPMVLGEIHAFMPSLAASFKLASPIVEIGAVVQDRPSCIVGDLSRRASMVPIEVRVSSPGSEGRVFRAEVARNRRLTPVLASMVITSAIADAEPDVTEMAVTMNSRLEVRNVGPVQLRDQLFSNDGMSPRLLASSRGVRAMAELLANPFEPAIVDRMEIDVKVEFRRDVAEIVAVSLPGDQVRAGDIVPLHVTLRPYAGPEYTQTIPVQIPRTLAGETVKVEVASGLLVRPDVAKPESLRGFIDNLRSFYTASSIVVSMSTADDGASMRGRLVPGLPQSALDTLRPGNQTRRADAYRLAERTVVPSARPVTGRQELSLVVREDVLGKNR